MKIGLLGYGRMGKIIERVALSRGHEISYKASSTQETGTLSHCDVAIDFSIPSVATQNLTKCFNNNVPVVSGTTGWLDHYDNMVAKCNEKEGAFIYASNFSLGVNIFFQLNKELAKMMRQFNDYSVNIEEIHHTKKLDAPSGTAITLAEGIIEETNKKSWSLDKQNGELDIPIIAKRIEDVPGTHSINYQSDIDTITITHEAHNREGFALGAVVAAEWLQNKKGVYTMQDVLNLS